MSMITENQVNLLYKLQLVGIAAVKNVNPVSISAEEADELLRMSLPPLEYINVIATRKDYELVEKHFIGVSENNCRDQMKNWLDKENITLLQQPNPYFGAGEMWLEYFAQPIKSVNFRALLDAFKRWEIKIPNIPIPPEKQTLVGHKKEKEVFETEFSALELAFDDCPEERLEIFAAYRLAADEREMNRVLPEQVEKIKALQAVGKAPKIERDQYFLLNRNSAAEYIKTHENNPKDTFKKVLYPKRTAEKKSEAFPEFKESNLICHDKADYLQRSILRDLATEGHICTTENQAELLGKIEFITDIQAREIIAENLDKPVGQNLLKQCKNYIESGKIDHAKEIKTISDVQNLYQVNRGFNYDKKAAMRDLIEGDFIQTHDGMAKIKYTTEAQDDAMIARHCDAPIGNNLRSKIRDLIEDAQIGSMDYEDMNNLRIKEALNLIEKSKEMERFKNPVPATSKQRNFIRALVGNKLLPSMPYDAWKALTANRASQLIASVPENLRQSITAFTTSTTQSVPVPER